MDLRLEGRTALVACQDERDARAVAQALVQEGAHVVTDAGRAADADVVVAGARRLLGSRLDLMEPDEVLRIWDPVAEVVEVYKAALTRMTAQRWGRIVWIGSAGSRSLDADDDEQAAVVSLGIRGLHKAIVAENGPAGVTVNTVLRHRDAAPEDVAAAVTFLCSDHAGYLAGTTITVDGGLGSAVF